MDQSAMARSFTEAVDCTEHVGKSSRVAILGGRGSGEIAADIIDRQARAGRLIELVGYLNDALPPGEELLGGNVIGPFAAWQDLADDIRIAAPLHKAKAAAERMERLTSLGIPDNRLATLVDPLAAVAAQTELAPGALVGAHAVVGPSVSMGSLLSLWPAAQLGHDVQAEDFVFVGRAAIVSGYCRLGCGAYVGPGAIVLEGRRVGRFAVVGAGAVVSKDVPDGSVVAGNPARGVAGQRL